MYLAIQTDTCMLARNESVVLNDEPTLQSSHVYVPLLSVIDDVFFFSCWCSAGEGDYTCHDGVAANPAA